MWFGLCVFANLEGACSSKFSFILLFIINNMMMRLVSKNQMSINLNIIIFFQIIYFDVFNGRREWQINLSAFKCKLINLKLDVYYVTMSPTKNLEGVPTITPTCWLFSIKPIHLPNFQLNKFSTDGNFELYYQICTTS